MIIIIINNNNNNNNNNNIYIAPVSLKFKDILQEQLQIVKSYEKALNLKTRIKKNV